MRATVKLLKLDGEPFEHIFALRASEELSLTEVEANDLFAAYMVQIDRAIEVVDSLEQRA